jgi:peptidoglycan/xylan/chitin deacetylase (PgdA/CDA1 family)
MSNERISRRNFLKGATLLSASIAFDLLLGENIFDTLNKLDREITGINRERERKRIENIEKYGVAKSIPAFEYHGDYYDMYPGYYMNPDYFRQQMLWLQKNDFYAVTADELALWLDGKIDLPGRSVVLTTDSGYTSVASLERMIRVLQETGMHFISLIWTKNMNPEESKNCNENICWETFRKALLSGVFSFGTHTETHRDFTKIDTDEGIWDLQTSIKEIEENLGITPICLSWPYEACPNYDEKIFKLLGIKFAFGGSSRPVKDMSVRPKDDLRYCLPRLLPPAPNGVSGRPNGKTMEDLMREYTTYPNVLKPKEERRFKNHQIY